MRVVAELSLPPAGSGMMAGMSDVNGSKMLVRTRDGRIVAGVCSGLARYFGIDANLIRAILAVVTVFSAGFGALAYLAAWVVIPEEGENSSIAENLVNKNRRV
jgi:phage shock protein C